MPNLAIALWPDFFVKVASTSKLERIQERDLISNDFTSSLKNFFYSASTSKLERIQERALISNDFTSSLKTLLIVSNTVPLHIRLMQTMTKSSNVFKIVNKLSPEYFHDFVNIKVSNYNFRNEGTAEIPRVKATRFGTKSFRYEATRI